MPPYPAVLPCRSPPARLDAAQVKAKLLANSAGLRAVMAQHGGKAPAKALAAEAARSGLGGNVAVSKAVLYRAQETFRKVYDLAFDKQFAEMPRFLESVCKENPGSYYCIGTDRDGDQTVFRWALLALGFAFDAIMETGRAVCSTDFGHSKHAIFEGVCALGIFQLGDGRLISPWAAVFAENESKFTWNVCAAQIKKAGMADLYDGVTHFRDRHDGALVFEEELKVKYPAFCTVHILRNIRSNSRLQKAFHDNMVWTLQASRSATEYATNLAAFDRYPDTMEYLRNIPPERWINYAMIERGAVTFGWRSNNMGEIGQGAIGGEIRKLHPLDFFAKLLSHTIGVIVKAADEHSVWAVAPNKPIPTCPDGVKRFTDGRKAAMQCNVEVTGHNMGEVQYIDPVTKKQHDVRVVNLNDATCTCLQWQAFHFPCLHAFALAMHLTMKLPDFAL